MHFLFLPIDAVLGFVIFHPRASGLIFLLLLAASLGLVFYDRKDDQ